jgi:hypothetical protein
MDQPRVKPRLMAVMLALLALAACGGDDDDASSEAPSTTTTTSASVAPPPDAVAALAQDVVDALSPEQERELCADVDERGVEAVATELAEGTGAGEQLVGPISEILNRICP